MANVCAAAGTEWLANQPCFNALGMKEVLGVTRQFNHVTFIQRIRTNDALTVHLLILNVIRLSLGLELVLKLL